VDDPFPNHLQPGVFLVRVGSGIITSPPSPHGGVLTRQLQPWELLSQLASPTLLHLNPLLLTVLPQASPVLLHLNLLLLLTVLRRRRRHCRCRRRGQVVQVHPDKAHNLLLEALHRCRPTVLFPQPLLIFRHRMM